MQKETKKVLAFSSLVFGVVFLMGCGNGSGQSGMNTTIPKAVVPNSDIVKNDVDINNPGVVTPDVKNLPTPTGKVDDAVDAIVDGIGKENVQVSSDESDAAAATDNSINSQAASDLGAGL